MIKCSHIAIASFSLALSFSTSLNAAMHFLPEYNDKWGSFGSGVSIGGRVPDEQKRCFDAGYKITSCPAGFAVKNSERCPYSLDKNYYKECYSLDSKCIEDGYTTSCAKGYEADKSRTCPQDSSYFKCKAANCSGYGYSQEEATVKGYVIDGEPCQSGGEIKYKRKPNPCTGYNYDSSNCGVSSCGTLSGGTPCWSGTVQKYKTCEPCVTQPKEEPLEQTSTCRVGDILYSDKTCSVEPIPSKIAIGVVFDANRGLAIALEQDELAWATETWDVPDLANKTTESAAKGDFAGKTNTTAILEYCKDNKKSCPAFGYVSSYKTRGTNMGDWYLPAFGELNELYLSRDVVNATLAKISGTSLCLGGLGCSCPWYWSSSESSHGAWSLSFLYGTVIDDYKERTSMVRPILAF